MGKMIEGRWWTDAELESQATETATGAYERAPSVLRHWIGDEGFEAEAGRYHLYVAYNCPWAHRTLLMRALKKLESVISVSYVSPVRTDQGWVFADGPYQDALYGVQQLHQIYAKGDDHYTGRVTVPVLWDKKHRRVVSNESADIVRMLNSEFNAYSAVDYDFYPAGKRREIDEWNTLIYSTVNNGVYRAGFSSDQQVYEEAVTALFATLDKLEAHLATNDYLLGDCASEADWRLFPTLARFDVAYYGAFKCNVRRLRDYPNLWAYARRLYHTPGVAPTVRFDIYKQGYYSANPKRNPLGIVPLGPEIDWS